MTLIWYPPSLPMQYLLVLFYSFFFFSHLFLIYLMCIYFPSFIHLTSMWYPYDMHFTIPHYMFDIIQIHFLVINALSIVLFIWNPSGYNHLITLSQSIIAPLISFHIRWILCWISIVLCSSSASIWYQNWYSFDIHLLITDKK